MDQQKFILEKSKIEGAVLVGLGALIYHGLTRVGHNFVEYLSIYPELRKLRAGYINYTYLEDYDIVNYMEDIENSTCRVPTVERAIIDYVRYEDYCEEEHLLQALDDYIKFHTDLSKLYEVSEFYGISKEKLDKLIEMTPELYEE